jgi:hypothetical protein
LQRQAAPGHQLRVGRLRHTRTQLNRGRVASKPSGLRLLHGACEPSCRMFPHRARATRVRSMHRTSAAGAGGGDEDPPKGPSVLGLSGELSRAARRAATSDATRRRQRGRRAAAADELRRTLPAPVYSLSTAPHRVHVRVVVQVHASLPFLFEVLSFVHGLRRH